MSVWLNDEITHHLHSLRIHQLQMVLRDHVLHEILMDQFPTRSPLVAILH